MTESRWTCGVLVSRLNKSGSLNPIMTCRHLAFAGPFSVLESKMMSADLASSKAKSSMGLQVKT